jgi:TIR domain
MHADNMAPECTAQGEASGKSYDVFISHAGQQKSCFAAWLQREMQRHGVAAFLDETSLQLGEPADVEMEAALCSCSIVVAVLTPDYLRSSYCMAELHWALHPQGQHSPLQQKVTAASGDASTDADRAAAQLQQPGQQFEVRRSDSKLPVLMPVFRDTSSIDALQQQMASQVAAAPEAGRAQAEQAGEDLAAACRHAGDRPDSFGRQGPEPASAKSS